jgi:sec-independent protein translocase protein TatA
MLAILVFGATRLPAIGEGLGKAIRNFRRGMAQEEGIDVTEADKQVEEQSSVKTLDATDAQTSDVEKQK